MLQTRIQGSASKLQIWQSSATSGKRCAGPVLTAVARAIHAAATIDDADQQLRHR